ncbi:MAG: hypothetical protein LUD12_17585 [Lachnospiraceae bacterium]|nr:hypothetical protein [Lachnospiraceae bacterium]
MMNKTARITTGMALFSLCLRLRMEKGQNQTKWIWKSVIFDELFIAKMPD